MPITVEHLSFAYGERPILNDLSFTVGEGETLLVQGASGCGKTTLLRLLLGLETPQSGRVEVPLKKAAVFQEDRLFRGLSAAGNIALVSDSATAARLLGEAGMEEFAALPPEKLSGGTRRRVAILRALASPFDALFLDEPFAGLDPENHRLFAALIRKYQNGKPLLLVSHDSEDAALFPARVLELPRLQD